MNNIKIKSAVALVVLLFLVFTWINAHPHLWDALVIFVFGAP